MGTGRLEGMVAVVTGSGRGPEGGMGAAIARVLGREGAKVVVNDLQQDFVDATVAQLRALGVETLGVVADIADPEAAAGLIATTVEQFGQIDILVNDAFLGGRRAPVVELTDADWEAVVAVNLHGPFYLSRAAIPHMRQRHYGRIINISSLAAIRVSLYGGAQYTATKEALLGLTRHLAVEGGQHGITANAILPAYTLTPRALAQIPPEVHARLRAAVPTQRGAEPEEIGYLAAFLASREAGQINGVAIPVDGAVSIVPGGGLQKRREILG